MRIRINTALFVVLGALSISACGTNEGAETTAVSNIQAEYPVYDTAEDIVDASDLVFSGTVVAIDYESLNARSETGPDSTTGLETATSIPYTIIDIDIDRIYKGNTEGDTIAIKCPGGVFDGTMYEIEDASTIDIGGTYLFIVQVYEDSYPSLLNVTQAVFDMNDSEAQDDEREEEGIALTDVLEYLEATNFGEAPSHFYLNKAADGQQPYLEMNIDE